jgi:hypothetical protein
LIAGEVVGLDFLDLVFVGVDFFDEIVTLLFLPRGLTILSLVLEFLFPLPFLKDRKYSSEKTTAIPGVLTGVFVITTSGIIRDVPTPLPLSLPLTILPITPVEEL